MTTPLEATQLIMSRFNAEYSTTTVKWPNVSFEEPTDDSAWVSFNVNLGDAIITTVSQKHNDQLGIVFINIFTKVRTGMIQSNTILQEVRGIFNRLTLSGIHFAAPEVRQIPTSADDIWLQQLVRIPFVYNEPVI